MPNTHSNWFLKFGDRSVAFEEINSALEHNIDNVTNSETCSLKARNQSIMMLLDFLYS